MNAPAEVRQINPLVEVRQQLDARQGEFAAALPAHIPVERFVRVVMTAIQNEPKLLNVERRSLFLAAMKCAQDGLLPDGRDAALVPYQDRNRGAIAQYMPMVGGIRKKARNSGEIATWDVHAVFARDHFEFELGDEPFIKHRPSLDEDRGPMIAVYSVATLKSGEKSRDVMSLADVMKIKALSRGTNTPWNNPTFFPEMAKKTVARRHSKVLPTSTDLDDLIRRDDNLYDLDGASDKAPEGAARKLGLGDRLAALAAPRQQPAPDPIMPDPDDGADDAGDDGAHGSPAEAQEARPQAEVPKDSPKPTPAATGRGKAGEPPLIEAGRAAAAKGSRAFDTWWLNLADEEIRTISDAAERKLREIAAEADARA